MIYKALEVIKIFFGTNQGVLRGPRGPKKMSDIEAKMAKIGKKLKMSRKIWTHRRWQRRKCKVMWQ